MSKDDGEQGNMGISSPEGGRLRAFGRFLLTVVIMLAIVMIALCFIVPRHGAMSFIEGRLSNRIGMNMSIDAARIGLPYVLVIEGAVSEGFELEDKGGFKADEIRLGLGWKTRWKVTIDRAVLRLADTEDDTWVPTGFSRFGPVPMERIDEVSRATEGFRRNVTLRVTDSTVRWISGMDGTTLAAAYGVALDVAPVRVPGRKMHYHRLSVYSVTHADGTKVSDVEREWLASEAIEYVEVHRSGREVPAAARDFWDPPLRRGEEDFE